MLQLKISISNEKDLGEPELAPGGYNGLLVLRWAPRLIILVLYINTIAEIDSEFYLKMYS